MAETLKIRDLPPECRPREVFMRSADPQKDLSDAMLLAILIRTGQKGSSAIDLANRLIKYFGNVSNLTNATWQQIASAKISGIGKVVSVQIAAAFILAKRNIRISQRSYKRAINSSDDVVKQILSVGIDKKQENTFVICLDTQRHPLCEPILVFRGILNATHLDPREIFYHAIQLSAASIIVVHTHPSGDPTPSEEDLIETNRLVETGKMIGIPIDDHVIIGCKTNHYVSIRGTGKIMFQ